MHDEPVLGPEFNRPPADGHEEPPLPERIRQLVNDQLYAVLFCDRRLGLCLLVATRHAVILKRKLSG